MSNSEREVVSVKGLGAPQGELWRWADKQVVRWGKLQPDDYDFRPWAKHKTGKLVNAELLNAGYLYEYVRESHKFRCLLVLHSERRPKKLRGPTVMEFKGSSAGPEHLVSSGWGTWLNDFCDELTGNMSFAELLRTNSSKVQKSLHNLDGYFLYPKAVELPGGRIGYPGSDIVEIQIFWRHYNDDEIGKEMKALAKQLRPAEWKAPRRRGKGKAASVVALLDALSAMRLRSHYPKHGTVNAIDKFDDVRLGKIGGVLIYSDLDEYSARAQRQFARWFPYGEAPANAITWAQRQRRKH